MAEKNFEHVSHKKSQLTRDIAPKEFYGLTPTANNSDNAGSSPVKLNLAKRPTPEQLIEGEIAVNYLKGHETLTIKNTENEIVGFVNENDFNEAQKIVALGLAQEKNERTTDNARFDDKFEQLDKNIDDLELVISSALNDLNSRILDNEDAIEDLSDEIGETIERELTEIVTTINEMTERIDENELAVSSSLNDLNTRIVENDEKIAEIENTFDEFDDGIERIELAVSSSLNDLNARIVETNEDIDNKYTELTEQVTTLEKEVHYNGSSSKYVDLGLPSGVLWGSYNLPIAINPASQYTNLYFAWGETEGYEECEIGVNRSFNVASYKWKWGQIDNNTPTTEPLKYNSSDNKTQIQPHNDAANVIWGGSWRLPSKEEVQELIHYTTCTYIEDNGGFVIFTSKINGEKLYVPCAGMASGTSINSELYEAYFWTRDVAEGNYNTKAYALYCRGDLPSIETIRRDKGLPIRPVTHKRRGQ